MARAQRALMALAFRTTCGAPPVGGVTPMPFAKSSPGAEESLLHSELLGCGRDPLVPIKDARIQVRVLDAALDVDRDRRAKAPRFAMYSG